MSYKVTAKATEYHELSEEEPYTVALDRIEGPFDSTLPGRNGRPPGTYFKVFTKVVKPGDDEDGFETSDTLPGTEDGELFFGKKTRMYAEGFLGREVDLDEEIDFDEMVGNKARVMMGTKESTQGGRFSRIEKFLKKSAPNGRR